MNWRQFEKEIMNMKIFFTWPTYSIWTRLARKKSSLYALLFFLQNSRMRKERKSFFRGSAHSHLSLSHRFSLSNFLSSPFRLCFPTASTPTKFDASKNKRCTLLQNWVVLVMTSWRKSIGSLLPSSSVHFPTISSLPSTLSTPDYLLYFCYWRAKWEEQKKEIARGWV